MQRVRHQPRTMYGENLEQQNVLRYYDNAQRRNTQLFFVVVKLIIIIYGAFLQHQEER